MTTALLLVAGTARAGHGLSVQPCRPQLANQSWNVAGGVLELAGRGECAEYGGDGVPLVLRPCNASNAGQRWTWVEAHGAIELAHPPGSASPACADIRGAAGNGGQPGDVGGYYPCHYSAGLPPNNEGWSQGAGGRITTTMPDGWFGSQWHGWCLTAGLPPPPSPPPPPPASGENNKAFTSSMCSRALAVVLRPQPTGLGTKHAIRAIFDSVFQLAAFYSCRPRDHVIAVHS